MATGIARGRSFTQQVCVRLYSGETEEQKKTGANETRAEYATGESDLGNYTRILDQELATPIAEDVRQWGSRRQATSSAHEEHQHYDWFIQ